MRGEPIALENFYDLFRNAQKTLGIFPLRDPYSTKETFVSVALTHGVSLTWLSEPNQNGHRDASKTLRSIRAFLGKRCHRAS